MDARQASGAEDDGRQGAHELADRVWSVASVRL